MFISNHIYYIFMLDPVQLQDASKSFVVPFGNRKAGQSYLYQGNNNNNNNVMSLSTASASSAAAVSLKNVKDMLNMFSQHPPLPPPQQGGASSSSSERGGGLATSSIVIPAAKKPSSAASSSSSGLSIMADPSKPQPTQQAQQQPKQLLFLPSTSYPVDLYLPTRDVVCQMYCCYLVMIGLVNIVLPPYTYYLAVMLCPLFTVSVLGHCMILYSFWNTFIGLIVCILYPLVVIMSSQHWVVSMYVILVLFFCNTSILMQTSYPGPVSQSMRYLHASVYVGLSVSCLVGIFTFQIYPKCIHGLHAAVLALACLCCASLIMAAKPRTYRIIAEAPPVSVKASMTDLQV